MSGPLLSLCHLTVVDADPVELVDAAMAGGFNAIGLRVVPPMPQDPITPVVGDERMIRRLLSKLGDTGISVLDVESIWIGPDLDIPGLRPALEVAQRLGTTNVLTMGNDPDEARLTDTFGRLCAEAAHFRLQVSLEFAAYTHASSIHQAQRIVSNANQPNGRILIDALHFFRSGGVPRDIEGLAQEWLSYCQLCDARGPRPTTQHALRQEARTGRYYPGEGEIPLPAILDALPAGLPIGVEAPRAEHAHLPVVERGRLCGAAAQQFLNAYQRTDR